MAQLLHQLQELLAEFDAKDEPISEWDVGTAVRRLREKEDTSEPPMEWRAEAVAFDVTEMDPEGQGDGPLFRQDLAFQREDGTSTDAAYLELVTPDVLVYWENGHPRILFVDAAGKPQLELSAQQDGSQLQLYRRGEMRLNLSMKKDDQGLFIYDHNEKPHAQIRCIEGGSEINLFRNGVKRAQVGATAHLQGFYRLGRRGEVVWAGR